LDATDEPYLADHLDAPDEPYLVDAPDEPYLAEGPNAPAEPYLAEGPNAPDEPNLAEGPNAPDESGPTDESDPTAEPDPTGDGPATPAEMLVAELLASDAPALRSELLLRLGRTGDGAAVEAIRPWTGAIEAAVRASAYEALGRLLDRDPRALEPHLRKGLADTDARVRRRVVLAAATARGVSLWPLLNGLREDPDPQVRRVVREVLRQTPPAEAEATSSAEGDASVPDRSLRAL
jgi:hypothetical protein